jgi:hypothetical protein
MNDHEIEKGLLKEKILTMKKCDGFGEQIKNDDDAERLREIYEYLQYRQREKKRIYKMSRTEYARHCKLEIDREIRGIKKAGQMADEKTWKRYGMMMLLAISRIKGLDKLQERHGEVS